MGKMIKCETCEGVGYIKKNVYGEIFTIKESEKIDEKLTTEPCPDCEGLGEVEYEFDYQGAADDFIKSQKEK